MQIKCLFFFYTHLILDWTIVHNKTTAQHCILFSSLHYMLFMAKERGAVTLFWRLVICQMLHYDTSVFLYIHSNTCRAEGRDGLVAFIDSGLLIYWSSLAPVFVCVLAKTKM